MTTLAAILGALPLLLGAGDGAEMRKPLGLTIIGGLVFSQILTLYTTPVVYLYLDRARHRGAGDNRRQAHLVATRHEHPGHTLQHGQRIRRGCGRAVREHQHIGRLRSHPQEDGLVALASLFNGRGGRQNRDVCVRATGQVDERGEDQLVAKFVLRATNRHDRTSRHSAVG